MTGHEFKKMYGNREISFICTQSSAAAAAAAAAAAVCRYSTDVAAAAVLPAVLFFIVCRMAKICVWFIESGPSVFFLFIQT